MISRRKSPSELIGESASGDFLENNGEEVWLDKS